MLVSEYPIGWGEVYIAKHGRREVLEIVGVKRFGNGRHILFAGHSEDGRRIEGSERIHFGASSFLLRYRPATPADFPTSYVNRCAVCRSKTVDTPGGPSPVRPRTPGVCGGPTVCTPDGTACFKGCGGAAGPGWQ